MRFFYQSATTLLPLIAALMAAAARAELPEKVNGVDGSPPHLARWYGVQVEGSSQKLYVDLNSFKTSKMQNSTVGIEGVAASTLIYVETGKNDPFVEMMVATFSCAQHLVSVSPFYIITDKAKPGPLLTVDRGTVLQAIEALACGTMKVNP